jgi:leucyl-tRNA synthetase
MELLNEMGRAKNVGAFGSKEWNEAADIYLRMLAPVCPHIAEELWERLGKPYSIHTQPWPQVDEEAAKEDMITLIIQVNGKLRDRILVEPGISDEEAQELALASEAVQQNLEDHPIRKIIVVPGRLVNIVI